MENHPLRGLFRVSSPRLEPQLIAPQPTVPTENIEYEIPSGTIEQLLANTMQEMEPNILKYALDICGRNLWIV